ncbi:MAG: glycosyltransferase 87 family protein [Ruminococcus sp.]
MTKAEQKFFEIIQKNILPIFIIAVTVLGVGIRFFGINFQSDDYNSFLYPWWVGIQNSGINGLATQVGNYNIPYQIITFIFTLLPFGPLYSYKIFSIIFDVVLAASAGLLVHSFSSKDGLLKGAVTYAVVLCSVTVIFNSAFWAQCDSIYVAFILLSVYFLKKDKNILSFVMLGISFAFKLQMIFILPFYLYYYISTRKISILHFLIIPAVDIIMCLPAVLLGRNIADIFTIYAQQTDYGKQIQMNFPNIYAFMCNGTDVSNYYLFKGFSIVFTIIVLGIGLGLIIYKKADLTNTENLLLTSIWTVFTCLMFLSSMHERYGYLIDILTIIYAVITLKHIWLPIICQLISLRGYCYYLFSYDVLDIKLVSIIYIGLYAFVTLTFIKEVVLNSEESKPVTLKKSR